MAKFIGPILPTGTFVQNMGIEMELRRSLGNDPNLEFLLAQFQLSLLRCHHNAGMVRSRARHRIARATRGPRCDSIHMGLCESRS